MPAPASRVTAVLRSRPFLTFAAVALVWIVAGFCAPVSAPMAICATLSNWQP